MIINNKLDKSFGPIGTTAGIFMLIVGIITTVSSFYGLFLVLFGALVGFSSTSAVIDFNKRRIKFSNNLFGIIRTGNWIQIEPNMKIGIKESNTSWRAYSRGNRTLDVDNHDFRLILFDSDMQEIMALKKNDSFDSAETELKILCNKLELSAFE